MYSKFLLIYIYKPTHDYFSGKAKIVGQTSDWQIAIEAPLKSLTAFLFAIVFPIH